LGAFAVRGGWLVVYYRMKMGPGFERLELLQTDGGWLFRSLDFVGLLINFERAFGAKLGCMRQSSQLCTE